MTTTNLYSGYDPSGKPSSRVINPPGGRTSNIFGGEEQPKPQVQQQAVQPEVDQNQISGATGEPLQQKQQQQSESSKKKASSGFNPITHEEVNSPSKDNEQGRKHPQQGIQQNNHVQKRTGKLQQPNKGKVMYNPITGEEYPEDYGQKKKGEGKEGEEESNANKNAESKTEENISSNAKSTGAPEQQQQVGKTPKKPAIKVRQPPGGASSGLW